LSKQTEKINEAFSEVVEQINYLETQFKRLFDDYYNFTSVFSIYNSMEKKMNEAIISALVSLYNLSLYSHTVIKTIVNGIDV
jgi:phage-related protein